MSYHSPLIPTRGCCKRYLLRGDLCRILENVATLGYSLPSIKHYIRPPGRVRPAEATLRDQETALLKAFKERSLVVQRIVGGVFDPTNLIPDLGFVPGPSTIRKIGPAIRAFVERSKPVAASEARFPDYFCLSEDSRKSHVGKCLCGSTPLPQFGSVPPPFQGCWIP